MSMTTVPDKYLDLVNDQKKSFAQLATLMPDGTPQVTPVWFDFTNGKIRVNTARGRVKDKNMKPGAPVAIDIVDPENPYRHLALRGKVAAETENGADAHIDSLAMKYMGKDKYPFRQPGEVRVIYEIDVTSASGMG